MDCTPKTCAASLIANAIFNELKLCGDDWQPWPPKAGVISLVILLTFVKVRLDDNVSFELAHIQEVQENWTTPLSSC